MRGEPGRRVRLFVGCELPPSVAIALAGWARTLAGGPLRPLPPASLHVTLFFLGPRDADELPALQAALRALPAARVPLATGAPARLGSVLAVDIEDVEGALGAVHASGFPGWEPERRPFRPHVTVARSRGRLRRLPELPPPPAAAFAAPALTLFRPHPGSRYEALERLRLPSP